MVWSSQAPFSWGMLNFDISSHDSLRWTTKPRKGENSHVESIFFGHDWHDSIPRKNINGGCCIHISKWKPTTRPQSFACTYHTIRSSNLADSENPKRQMLRCEENPWTPKNSTIPSNPLYDFFCWWFETRQSTKHLGHSLNKITYLDANPEIANKFPDDSLGEIHRLGTSLLG